MRRFYIFEGPDGPFRRAVPHRKVEEHLTRRMAEDGADCIRVGGQVYPLDNGPGMRRAVRAVQRDITQRKSSCGN